MTFEYHYGDVFENEFTIQRTEWYHVISHPYAFFDALNPVIGATDCLTATATYRARVEARMTETGGVSPIDIHGEFAEVGDEYIVMADYTLVDNVPLDYLQATLLLYEDDVFFCCGPGGNNIWDGVVRTFYDAPITLSTVGEPVQVAISFVLDPSWNRANLRIVALVQDVVSREIYQGHRVTEPSAAVGDPAMAGRDVRLLITPNPTRGPVSMVVDVSRENPGPVRLDILDVAGRRVEGLSWALSSQARGEILWDGAGHAPGVYFVRLESPAGTLVRRLVRIE